MQGYNVTLQGKARIAIEGFESDRPYRVARVEEVRSVPFADPEEQARVLSAAMALPSREAELSIDAVYSLLAHLKRHR